MPGRAGSGQWAPRVRSIAARTSATVSKPARGLWRCSSTSQRADLLLGGDDGRVVPAAEVAADLAVGGAGVLAGQVHGEHPGVGHGPGAAVGLQGVGGQLEERSRRPAQCPSGRSPGPCGGSCRGGRISPGSGRAACRSGRRGRGRCAGPLPARGRWPGGARRCREATASGSSTPRAAALALRMARRVAGSGASSLTTIPPRSRVASSSVSLGIRRGC